MVKKKKSVDVNDMMKKEYIEKLKLSSDLYLLIKN